MKISRYIYILIALAVSSCSKGGPILNDIVSPPPSGNLPAFISGSTCDQEGNPIEHIRVTIDWNPGNNHDTDRQDIKYTNSIGKFAAEIPPGINRDAINISITLEDIDGEENGGLFKPLTDNITLFGGDAPPTGSLDYRLTRATASESSPQS